MKEELLVSGFYAKTAENIFIPVSTATFTTRSLRDADHIPQRPSVIEEAEITVRNSFLIKAISRDWIQGEIKPLIILKTFSMWTESKPSQPNL